jgi:hypothetical protein
MLNIKTGFGGSLNATSWQTATDVRAYPRFAHARGTDEVPSNSLSNVPGTVPDDFYWDSQFGLPGVSGTVNALAISGNDVYVGGSFTMAGSGSMSSIAKWNGSSWSALGSGVGGVSYPAVNAVAVSGNDVYVGGDFTTAGGVSVSKIAKWNMLANTWTALDNGVDGSVYAIAISGSDVYVGGSFTTAGGVSANNIAKWNGNSWSALGGGVDGSVLEVAINGSNIYVGGSFVTAGGVSANRIAKWNGSTWAALGSGVSGCSPLCTQSVDAIAIDGKGDVYVGGGFAEASGVSAKSIAKWNNATNTWSPVGDGISGGYGVVSAIIIVGNDVYVGGEFGTAGSVSANQIAKWNGSTWSALGDGVWGGYGHQNVNAIAANAGGLYAGGWFLVAGTVGVGSIAKWNGNSWVPLGNGANKGVTDPVHAIATSGSDVYLDFGQRVAPKRRSLGWT